MWGQWSIYRYDQSDYTASDYSKEEEQQLEDSNNISLFEQMVQLAAEV